jgi:hypothetical protein
MYILAAKTEDAAACTVLRRSIAELCQADHGADDVLLGKWLSNKTVEYLTRWVAQSHFLWLWPQSPRPRDGGSPLFRGAVPSLRGGAASTQVSLMHRGVGLPHRMIFCG